MKRSRMKRGNRAHYRALGKLGAGIAKSYPDPESVKEQRRQAGIASGKARARNAKVKPVRTRADMTALASQIRRLNENAKALSD